MVNFDTKLKKKIDSKLEKSEEVRPKQEKSKGVCPCILVNFGSKMKKRKGVCLSMHFAEF